MTELWTLESWIWHTCPFRTQLPFPLTTFYGCLTHFSCLTPPFAWIGPTIHPSIGTILCIEHWCLQSSVMGYWAQSWTSRHSDAGYSNGSIIPASWYSFCQPQKDDRLSQPIHPLGPYSVQSVGAAEAVSLAIWHNPGRVAIPTQDTSKLALILPTSEG